jgi:hypothetical protein
LNPYPAEISLPVQIMLRILEDQQMLRWHCLVDCCLAQSRSNCFPTLSDIHRSVPGSAHRCCITVDCI